MDKFFLSYASGNPLRGGGVYVKKTCVNLGNLTKYIFGQTMLWASLPPYNQ